MLNLFKRKVNHFEIIRIEVCEMRSEINNMQTNINEMQDNVEKMIELNKQFIKSIENIESKFNQDQLKAVK